MGAGSEVLLEPEVMIPAACGRVRSSGGRCFSEQSIACGVVTIAATKKKKKIPLIEQFTP